MIHDRIIIIFLVVAVAIRPSAQIHGDLNARIAFWMEGNLNARNPT